MIHVLVPSLVGLAGAILAWRDCAEAADRRNWSTIIFALVGAAALSLLVFRSVSTAPIFALPGCAWLGLRAWSWARTIACTVPRTLSLALAALTFSLLRSAAVAAVLTPLVPGRKSVWVG